MARAAHVYAFGNGFFTGTAITYNNYTVVSWGNQVYLANNFFGCTAGAKYKLAGLGRFFILF